MGRLPFRYFRVKSNSWIKLPLPTHVQHTLVHCTRLPGHVKSSAQIPSIKHNPRKLFTILPFSREVCALQLVRLEHLSLNSSKPFNFVYKTSCYKPSAQCTNLVSMFFSFILKGWVVPSQVPQSTFKSVGESDYIGATRWVGV